MNEKLEISNTITSSKLDDSNSPKLGRGQSRDNGSRGNGQKLIDLHKNKQLDAKNLGKIRNFKV